VAAFLYQYALAMLWEEWGVRAETVIGHGTGEYAAACLAGVLSFEDALAASCKHAGVMTGNEAGDWQPVLRRGVVPLASSAIGNWVLPEKARHPHYGTPQASSALLLTEAVTEVVRNRQGALWVGIGHGNELQALVESLLKGHALVSPEDSSGDECREILTKLARIWVEGVAVDWRGFHAREKRHRIRLPGYPFERRRYWIDAPRPGAQTATEPMERPDERKQSPENWFYYPIWKQKPAFDSGEPIPRRAFILADEGGVADRIADTLSRSGVSVTTVQYQASAQLLQAEFAEVLERLQARGDSPDVVVYCAPLDIQPGEPSTETLAACRRTALLPLVGLLRGIDRVRPAQPARLLVVTHDAYRVIGSERLVPESAPVTGLVKVISQEFPGLSWRVVDISREPAPQDLVTEQIAREALNTSADPVVAYRGRLRWVQACERMKAPTLVDKPRNVRDGGTYIIPGGLGFFGLQAAAVLARAAAVNLVLMDRRRADAAANAEIFGLREMGAQVEVRQLDVADSERLQEAVRDVVTEFGGIDGVIHAAGCPEEMKPLTETNAEVFERHLAVKMGGTAALKQALAGVSPRFVLLVSSLSSLLGGLGLGAYAASNAFLDGFAQACPDQNWMSVNFDTWEPAAGERPAGLSGSRSAFSMTRQETADVLRRVLSVGPGLSQLIVSAGDLESRLRKWTQRSTAPAPPDAEGHDRPQLSTPYLKPSTGTEEVVARIWGEALGIARVGLGDNFFEMGGDSLLATQIVARMRDHFRVELPLRRLFEMPTIEGVCAVIENARRAAGDNAQLDELLAEIEAGAPDKPTKTEHT
jgi:acyl transferase domain-containing protein/acyl carrier protein